MARTGFAGRRRKLVPELLNSSCTGCADSTAENVVECRHPVTSCSVLCFYDAENNFIFIIIRYIVTIFLFVLSLPLFISIPISGGKHLMIL